MFSGKTVKVLRHIEANCCILRQSMFDAKFITRSCIKEFGGSFSPVSQDCYFKEKIKCPGCQACNVWIGRKAFVVVT